ncbi:partial Pyruvate-flavodoxin oxidoreductase, partial [Anaerolineae bacterium]
KNPLTLDSKIEIEGLEDFMYKQGRFNVLRKQDPDRAHELMELEHHDVLARWNQLMSMASTNGK